MNCALVRDEDEIVVGVEVPLENALFEDEVVGDFVLVEGIADPTDILGSGPGAEHGDARKAGGVHGDLRLCGEGDEVESKLRGQRVGVVDAEAGMMKVPAGSVTPEAWKDFSAIWTGTSLSA